MVLRRLSTMVVLGWCIAAGSTAGLASTDASATTPVAPGTAVRQGHSVCTVGYVDTRDRIAFTAGHCRDGAPSTGHDGSAVGEAWLWQFDAGGSPSIDRRRSVIDYEVIGLAPGVEAGSVLPDGRTLAVDDSQTAGLGQPVCVAGAVSGQTCGVIDGEANGWFTMDGVRVAPGDSGAPVYVERRDGSAVVVGLLVGRWGDHPAAVSWQAVTDQVVAAVGADPSIRRPGRASAP